MTIRPANEQDIDAIRAVALATWPVAYGAILSPAQMAYMLDRMYAGLSLKEQMTRLGHRFLVAEHEYVVVGFASFETEHRGRKVTRLHKLYVTPTTQGSGAGKALLTALISVARESGDGAVELNVNKYNRAKEFYLRQGFVVVRDEVINIGEGYVMDDHVLKRTL